MSLGTEEIDLSDLTQSLNEFQALTVRSSPLYATLPVLGHTTTIRVLDLHGNKRNPRAPLSGTLRLVDLKDRPKSAALSYVWGSWSSPKDTIACNNYRLEITTNCHEALVSLRNLFGTITIWVDSICVDQENDLEKATQIPLMSDIFTYAQPTYIWLGRGSNAKDRAMECIKLSSRLRVPPIAIPWFRKGRTRRPAQDVLMLALEILKAWMSSFFCKATLLLH